MSFEDFLNWARQVEPTMEAGEQWYFKQAYDYAVNYAMLASAYLPDFQLKAYIYSLALHLIILTPLDTNTLFLKYFPSDDTTSLRLKNYGAFVSSVSDNTSSVSNFAYAGLANMSVGDAMLMLTPYGAFCKSINESLKNVIVVV